MKRRRIGPRLTLKTARELALKVTGTAKGLEKDKTTELDIYKMQIGELFVNIRYDWYGSGRIAVSVDNHFGSGINMLFNPETLEEDYEAEDRQKERERREALEQWVGSSGPDTCKAVIDRIWNQQ